ncbi:MAG TPA: hypothetical protein VIO60_01510 [Rectinemataceae bacterium]
MDSIKTELDRILAMKRARRSQLSALPFEQKVRLVVELQKIQAPILRARGINVKVWNLGDLETSQKIDS